MNNKNTDVIIALCSYMCIGEGVLPLEPKEWTALAKKLMAAKKQPYEIFDFTDDDYKVFLGSTDEEIVRIKRLLDRSASISFEVEKLREIGIEIVTRADKEYPLNLKKKLGQSCPPLFYYAGDIGILNDEFVGFVGARSASEEDLNFTELVAGKMLKEGFSLVSGGAKGVDSKATETAIFNGGAAVEFLADSLLKKIKKSQNLKALRDGRMLLISAAKPDAGFNVGMAMQRNRYIYAQSLSTIVVKSDFEKGGTWTGAVENLHYKWAKTYCWDNKKYRGNVALIKQGAIPLTEETDPKDMRKDTPQPDMNVQQTIFDL